jgi:hypothetical protein
MSGHTLIASEVDGPMLAMYYTVGNGVLHVGIGACRGGRRTMFNKYAASIIALLATSGSAVADFTVWQTTCTSPVCGQHLTSSAGVYTTQAQAVSAAQLAAKTFPAGTCPPGTYCKYDGVGATKAVCEDAGVDHNRGGYFFCVAPSGRLAPAPTTQPQGDRVQKLLKW